MENPTEVMNRIETDLDALYKMCREGLSKCGARNDAREFELIELARIEIAAPLARYHIVADKLEARL